METQTNELKSRGDFGGPWKFCSSLIIKIAKSCLLNQRFKKTYGEMYVITYQRDVIKSKTLDSYVLLWGSNARFLLPVICANIIRL